MYVCMCARSNLPPHILESQKYGGLEGSNSILHTQTFTQVQNLFQVYYTKPIFLFVL